MQHRSAGFYLDECLPHTVAKALRLVKHDIEDPTHSGQKGRSDEDLLTWLQQEERNMDYQRRQRQGSSPPSNCQ